MTEKGILVVDDERVALKYFSRAFGEDYPIYSVGSAAEALELLKERGAEIGVVVTDQRMPETSGLELLEEVRDVYPDKVRILTTAYTDLSTLVTALNSGAVYAFVAKPWVLNELDEVIREAMRLHEAQVSDSELVAGKWDELRAKILEDRVYDVGRVAAKIGHYVHNALCPMTFVIDQLVEHGVEAPNLPLTFLKDMRSHLAEVARTLKDLEQLTGRREAGQLETVDLRMVAERALEETSVIRHQKALTFRTEIADDTPKISADPLQIAKLFRFLIAEDVISLPQGSEVTMRISAHEVDGEVLGARVECEDSVPVAPHVCPDHLLHPFNLRGSNPREFGVFLVSCYFIVRLHGGSLTARISDSGGLLLSLFLPLEAELTTEGLSENAGSLFGGFDF